ncbi:MAG: hypothetical protein E7Z99_08990 [Coriobacteriaceae bacterium]|jgi:hypothetical protein|nr:hypothetical protein [Coriobacteriaceae bacterium]
MAVKQGLGAAFAAEMKRVVFKPQRLIAATVFAAAAVLVYMGATAVVDWTVNEAASSGFDANGELASIPSFLGYDASLSLISFCFGIYASAFSARDYNDGTILSTLLLVPNRGRLFAARMLPWVLLTAAFSFVAFTAIGVMGVQRVGFDAAMPIFIQGLLATVASVLTAMVGFCCGTVTKRGSLSVFLFLGLFFLLPTVLGMVGGFGPEFLQTIVEGIDLAMPGNAFGGLLSMVPLSGATTETWISLGVSIAWAVGSTVLAYALFKSRATLGR